MRIILLSIAFIFLAFSAQSQVLKSAGVWYFLDVDSMTARPAVLPNGTELAYVVGTKTVYYWNRATSTWAAYGSTFNRDSIYFDASIIGSGTVYDPWGVDSTLFATIAGVGDSIAAAVANYFPLEGGTLTGTGGAGFIGLPSQGTAPGTPASGLNIFAQGSSFNWKGTDGFERQITSSPTGGRNYALPDINGTFALGTGTTDRSARWSATNTLAAGNITDNGTKLQALLPWQFQTYTTAGLPTGVTGYTLYNSTIGGIGWYDGSRYNYVPKADRSAFTNTYIPYATTTGQLTENSNFLFVNSPTRFLQVGGVKLVDDGNGRYIEGQNGIFLRGSNNTNNLIQINSNEQRVITTGLVDVTVRNATNTKTATFTRTTGTDGYSIMELGAQQNSGTKYGLIRAESAALGGTGTPVNLLFSPGINTTTLAQGNTYIGHNGTSKIGNVGIGQVVATEDLDIVGDIYIRDSTRLTTTPAHSAITGLLTRDATGWVGLASISGLYYSAGTLAVQNIGNTNLTLTGNRELDGAKKSFMIKNNGFFSIQNQSSGWGSDFEIDTFSRTYQYRFTDDTGEPRYILGHARGTLTSPTSSLESDRTGGYYFNGYQNSGWRKTAVILGSVDSVGSGSYLKGAIQFGVDGNGFPESAGNIVTTITDYQTMYKTNQVFTGRVLIGSNWNNGVDKLVIQRTIPYELDLIGRARFSGKFIIGNDSTLAFDPSTDVLQLSQYGTGTKEATDLSKTQSNYIAGFATDGTVLDLERKRDTTIYIDDADYDFSAAITTAQISRRYSRVIFWMTTTAGAGSDSEITLHTPDVNLMQVEYLIHSVDEAGGFANVIRFGSNNAVDSTNGLVSSYFPAAGDGIHIRAGLRSSVYKYRYSN